MMNEKEEVIQTPDLSHLSEDDYDKVYEPREDSFLFLDALEKDLNLIRSFKPRLCLEVGCGSGIISTAVARALGSSCFSIATDLNPHACLVTHKTASANDTYVDSVRMDLGSMLKMKYVFDLLLFNPPYCVTPTSDVHLAIDDSSLLQLAWAGGLNGREVTDRLLHYIHKLLSHKALFYLVVIKENNPEEISHLLSLQGFQGKIVATRKVKNEQLSVMRFQRGF